MRSPEPSVARRTAADEGKVRSLQDTTEFLTVLLNIEVNFRDQSDTPAFTFALSSAFLKRSPPPPWHPDSQTITLMHAAIASQLRSHRPPRSPAKTPPKSIDARAGAPIVLHLIPLPSHRPSTPPSTRTSYRRGTARHLFIRCIQVAGVLGVIDKFIRFVAFLLGRRRHVRIVFPLDAAADDEPDDEGDGGEGGDAG